MKNKLPDNYLARIPKRAEGIAWSKSDDGKVTLEIENRGVFNRIAQKLFKKPRISYVHLDEMGSFIWPIIDGKKDIVALGEEVIKEFGEKANPLYERLARYMGILESYNFITWAFKE